MQSRMHSTDNEILEIVDSQDRVIGSGLRGEIHRKGLMHRAVHLFVFNTRGEIYVQRRSAYKDRHPLKLDSSAAGHVGLGESYESTAVRELQEELGIISGVDQVLRVAACDATDNEHVVLFKVVSDAEPVPNPDEILWGAFMKPQEVSSLMDKHPKDFVPAFMLLWKEYVEERS